MKTTRAETVHCWDYYNVQTVGKIGHVFSRLYSVHSTYSLSYLFQLCCTICFVCSMLYKLSCLSSSSPEAEFLDVIWHKILKIFPPCYLQSPLQLDFTPPPPPPSLSKSAWVETGLQCKHCIRKPQVWELSRLCPEFHVYLRAAFLRGIRCASHVNICEGETRHSF